MIYGYGRDDVHLQVWLDAWTSDDRPWPFGARGAVCQRHGSLLTAPRGWVLIDRREEVPRLFMPRPVLVHSRPADPSEPIHRPVDSSGEQRRRRVADLPTPQLFLEARAEQEALDKDEGDARVSSDVADPVLDADTDVPAQASHESNETSDDVGVDTANLSSLLDATGPLLRRAFSKRNTGRDDPSQELMRPTHRVVDESA